MDVLPLSSAAWNYVFPVKAGEDLAACMPSCLVNQPVAADPTRHQKERRCDPLTVSSWRDNLGTYAGITGTLPGHWRPSARMV